MMVLNYYSNILRRGEKVGGQYSCPKDILFSSNVDFLDSPRVRWILPQKSLWVSILFTVLVPIISFIFWLCISMFSEILIGFRISLTTVWSFISWRMSRDKENGLCSTTEICFFKFRTVFCPFFTDFYILLVLFWVYTMSKTLIVCLKFYWY